MGYMEVNQKDVEALEAFEQLASAPVKENLLDTDKNEKKNHIN